jgi:hypothetical protein
MFRVGRYLAPVVEDRWPGLWVELEFNRMAGDERSDSVKKVGGLDSVTGMKRSVVLDLIVHDRGGSSMDQNILVAEARKQPADANAEECDLRKLKAYRKDLGYQYAVYLELGRQPRSQWIGSHHEFVPVADIWFSGRSGHGEVGYSIASRRLEP